MVIDKDEIKKITKLSSIYCEDSDLKAYANNLSKIVSLFCELKTVNTDNVEALHNINNDYLTLRSDVVLKKNSKQDILINTMKSNGGFYTVPKVLE